MKQLIQKLFKPAKPILSQRSIELTIAACVPVPRMDASGSRRQLAKLARPVDPGAHTLFLGDSLLANWSAGDCVHNLAVGGDRVQNTIWMLSNMKPDAASHPFERVAILVGTNNITRRMGSAATCAGLRLLWQMARERWPDAEVVAMTIPHRRDQRADEDVRRRINDWMLANKAAVTRVFDTDFALRGEPEPLGADGLHLSQAAYARLNHELLEQAALVEGAT